MGNSLSASWGEGRGEVSLCRQLIESARKQFGHPRVWTDSNQAVSKTIQTFKWNRAALLRCDCTFLIACGRSFCGQQPVQVVITACGFDV